MFQMLSTYIEDNIALSKRFSHAPHGKATCKMLLDQSFGAIDFVTNHMEYDAHYGKNEVDEIYALWYNDWLLRLREAVDFAEE